MEWKLTESFQKFVKKCCCLMAVEQKFCLNSKLIGENIGQSVAVIFCSITDKSNQLSLAQMKNPGKKPEHKYFFDMG